MSTMFPRDKVGLLVTNATKKVMEKHERERETIFNLIVTILLFKRINNCISNVSGRKC